MQDLWYTLEEGKFPPKTNVLDNLKEQDASLQIMDMLSKIPPEQAEAVMQQIQQIVQQMSQQPQTNGPDLDAFVQTLPDEIIQQLQSLPQDQQEAYVQQLLQQQQQGTPLQQ
jgi:DNA-directed RNA polymerase specialized sigma24 family protein